MKYYGQTHVGYRRSVNQDSFLIEEKDHVILALVCDGIGGGNAGDVASQMACELMREAFYQIPIFEHDCDIKSWLEYVIRKANDAIFAQSRRKISFNGMGTTLVGALIFEDETYIFNVGDSRIYSLYSNDFICLTEDHSYIFELIKSGKITLEEARKHPNRNVLVNALGIWDHVRIDVNKIQNNYDLLLICSDGLHGYVQESVIEHTLQQNIDTKAKVEKLIQYALDVGGFDNVSAVVLEREGKCHG